MNGDMGFGNHLLTENEELKALDDSIESSARNDGDESTDEIIFDSTEEDDFDNILQKINKKIEKDPNSAKLYRERAEIYDFSLNFESAIKDYTKSIDLEPDCSHDYYNRSSLLWEVGRDSDAINDIDYAIELDPDKSHFYYQRAEYFTSKGMFHRSLEDVEKYLEFDYYDIEAHIHRFCLRRKIGRISDSIREIESFEDANPESVSYWLLLAKEYMNRGMRAEALDTVENIKLNDHASNSFHIGRAKILGYFGEFDEAHNELEELDYSELEFSHKIDRFDRDQNKGLLYLKAGRPEDAKQSFSNAIDANPYFYEAWIWLGRSLIELGRPNDALHKLYNAKQQYEKLMSAPPSFFLLAGIAFGLNGSLENGVKWLNESYRKLNRTLLEYEFGIWSEVDQNSAFRDPALTDLATSIASKHGDGVLMRTIELYRNQGTFPFIDFSVSDWCYSTENF